MSRRMTGLLAGLLFVAGLALAYDLVGANGTFTTTQDNGRVTTTYTPKPGNPTCSSIYMVQTCRDQDQNGNMIEPKRYKKNAFKWLQDDMTPGGTYVDHIVCEKDPYYNGEDAGKDSTSKGSNNGTSATPTTMSDRPHYSDDIFPDGVTQIQSTFEVCAVCKDDGRILDCYEWVYLRDKGDGTRGIVATGAVVGKPSKEFIAAKKKFEQTHQNGAICPETEAEIHQAITNALAAIGQTTPYSPYPETPFSLELDIVNSSGVNMIDVEYEVFLDGMPLTSGTVLEIPYFDFETVTIDMPPLTAGPHSVILEVDPLNLIMEYDETDNVAFEELEITDVSPVADETRATGLFLQMLQPNPTHGDFNVMLRLGTDAPAVLRVVDIRGRVVETRSIMDVAGNLRTERFHLDSRLSAGTYFVMLEQNGVSETRKFILLK